MKRRRKTIKTADGKTRVIYADGLETAAVKPAENAMKPSPTYKNLGGGWYELPDGRKVRKSQLEKEEQKKR